MKGVCYIWFLCLSAFMYSCTTHSYVIKGEVSIDYPCDSKKVMLIANTPEGFAVFDSCTVRHSVFHMNGNVEAPTLVMLCVNDEPLIPIYVEGGKTKIRLALNDIQASGTRQNDLLFSFFNKKRALDVRFAEALQKRHDMLGFDDISKLQACDSIINGVVNEIEDCICKFIMSNYDEEVAEGLFSMLTSGVTEDWEIQPYIKRILDNAPKSFFHNESVSNYVRCVGYRKEP